MSRYAGRRRLLAATAAALCTTSLAVATPATARATPNPAPGAVDSAGAAVKAARSAGKAVEVLSQRTETTQVFAEPSGRLRYEASAVPLRTRRADGSWADIDTKLAKGGDGQLHPAATLADVRFSPGGSGPAATLTRDGNDLTLTWPHGALPAPAVTGDSATYAEVLPGVDLVLRATRTGFTHVLVVKNAQAAANPAVREIRFDLGGDARTKRLPDGSLQAAVGGELVASAAAPQMWDSTDTATTAQAKSLAGVVAEKSSHSAPGDLARTAALRTEVTTGGDLVLRPDTNLLGARAKFPVYIDPAWDTGKSRWAYATNNNTNNTDVSRARVGTDPDGRTYRSFFEFNIKPLANYHIEDAYVQMKVDHSWSCNNTPNSMYQAGSIATPRSAWSTSLVKFLATVSSHANEGSGCSDSPQPDMTVNFNTDAVTSVVNTLAGKGTAAVVFGFSARDSDGTSETDGTRWKKYFPENAKLIVNRDAKPTKPSSLQVNGVACGTGDIRIGTTTPNFSAYVGDADGTTQTLKATWEFFTAPEGAALVTRTPPVPVSATANTRATSARVSALASGGRFAFRVHSTDPAPYNIDSPASALCYFVIDTTSPPVTVTPVTEPAGPGKPATFKISSTATDVVSFQYGWNEAVTSSVTATSTMNGTTVTGKEATVTVTANKYGIAILYAQATDSTLNRGYGSAQIIVPRPSPAVARWDLETRPGIDATAALIDQAPALAGDNVLTPSALAWADKGRVIGAQDINFTGTTSLTTPKVVDTTSSWSVAAWAKLDNLTDFQTLVSQDGTNTANFQLQMRVDDVNADGTADKSWCVGMRNEDVAATTAYTYACAINTAVAGRWTHVAGSYDATAKRLAIWVDGVQKASAGAPAAWASNGPLRLGNRKYTTTSNVDNLYGSLADVQVFDRVLVQDDFTGQSAADPDSGGFDEPGILAATSVGKWDFETAVPCNVAGEADMCEAPDAGTGWKRRLLLSPGTFVDAGNSSAQSLVFDNVHYADDSATKEYGTSQRDVAPDDSATRQWQDGPVARTDQSFAVSVWVQPARITGTMTAVSQRGNKQSSFYLGTRQSTVNGVAGMRFEVMIPSADADTGEFYTHLIAPTALGPEDVNDWFHLVFVYDTASVNQLSLYVNGAMQATKSGVLWHAGGALTVGGSWYTPDAGTQGFTDQWFGAVDDLEVFQGVLTGGQLATLFPGPDAGVSIPGPHPRTDFNGDGNADVVGIEGSTKDLVLYAGNGSGQVSRAGFMWPNTPGRWTGITKIAAGDFNNDNKADIMAIGADGTLRMYKGNGLGQVGNGVAAFGTAAAWGGIPLITAGDFNGDGWDDVVATGADGNIRLYANNGAGVMKNGVSMWPSGTGWANFVSIVAGDYNGDGKMDIAGINGSGNIYFYAGNGAGTLSGGVWMYAYTPQGAWGTYAKLTSGDYNNDGRTDIAGVDGPGNLYLFKNNGLAVIGGGALMYSGGGRWATWVAYAS